MRVTNALSKSKEKMICIKKSINFDGKNLAIPYVWSVFLYTSKIRRESINAFYNFTMENRFI